jgi:excisionase family DNA binding protein
VRGDDGDLSAEVEAARRWLDDRGFVVWPDGRIRPEAVAAYLGITRRTLEDWIKQGKTPPVLILGARTRFFVLDDLVAWMDRKRRRSMQ